MEKLYMQITLKNGVHIQIGVANATIFNQMKSQIISGKKKFIDLLGTCTVKADEVVLMELLSVSPEEESHD